MGIRVELVLNLDLSSAKAISVEDLCSPRGQRGGKGTPTEERLGEGPAENTQQAWARMEARKMERKDLLHGSPDSRDTSGRKKNRSKSKRMTCLGQI